ncbi:MAG: hypothetical protein ACPL88_00945, partial [Bryobacteraceae bacterium]
MQKATVQALQQPTPDQSEQGDGHDRAAFIRPAIRSQPESAGGERFQWEPALRQAGFFLAIMHGWRLATEPGTRAGLRGPFLRDYAASVKRLRGWGDGDPF